MNTKRNTQTGDLELSSTHTVVSKVSPSHLAELFWLADDEQQVEFLNHLAEISGGLVSLQLQHITDNDALTDSARGLMQKFGEYAEGESS